MSEFRKLVERIFAEHNIIFNEEKYMIKIQATT